MLKRSKKLFVLLLACIMTVSSAIFPKEVSGAVKQYGIIVADKNGKYSFYDLNSKTKAAGIEITQSGNIMVPLKKLTSLMPALSFSYDSKMKKAAVVNISNGRKVTFTKDSNYCDYYANSKSKPVKKSMPYKAYISTNSSVMMIHMSALKWVMSVTTGVKSFKTAEMQTTGYDTYTYSGLIAYNPYGAVSAIPKATSVTNISNTVKVTIPEGYSVAQVFNLLVKKGVCPNTTGLYDALNNYDYSKYTLVNEIVKNKNRCFRLEGYLFPDTYEFYRLSKPEDAIGKFLRNTESKITAQDREKAESLGYSMDEILTIASLIEKEAGNSEQKAMISSVIHNRLNDNMKLQLDASIFYVERYIKPYITGDINRYNSYYNTYKCSALPAGPICNPGKASIQAALNPAETDYLYFYSDENGKYYYASTYEEIQAVSGK
ncbi:endolytic transglycosylase MltG [Anaerocolumna sedimenticola]|uniref:Endolytic murein transglycosylase n=1 Tax=Anaerocolumna sedimenticola TaxID=2696063 RepID=A0A6P1TT08_9FIRM|nr:endolytic transglycosylase MltG [Anaerocolumna sedimenticola]QHQ62595.1 endolytic transglycosylase MltG [Anaerocolumna sedimenticola]